MDDLSKHEVDELEDTAGADELQDEDLDEGGKTPADTNDGKSEDDPKTPAEEERERQKNKWLSQIREGKKTLDDMPENLGWLRKDIEAELPAKKSEKKSDDDFDERVRKALKAEREQDELSLLVDDLEQNASSEKVAQVKEEYESLRADGLSPLKALIVARKLAGLKDSRSTISERRRKGMMLPPDGTRGRKTVDKNKMTEIEKRLSGDLPPGFKA